MILIARHAETVDNAARVIQAPAAPLSAAGQAQAERLAERIAVNGVARILASDFIRAVATARCIAARLGIEVEEDPVLRERDFGDLRGTLYAALTTDPFASDYVPPNGESWAVFHARVGLAWERIRQAAAETPGNLLVVTHGLVCRSLVANHLALQPGDVPPSRWGNTSLTEIEAVPPWRVQRLNCVAHLADKNGNIGE